MKRLFSVLAGAALVASMAIAVAPAGAQRTRGIGVEPPWPTLRVMKTYPEGRGAPAGTVFTMTVNCVYLDSAGAGAESFPETTLTFKSTGVVNNQVADPAAPDTADPEGDWVKDGNYWSLTSKWLTDRRCTVEETGASNGAVIDLTTLKVQYGCDFVVTKVELAWVPSEAEPAGQDPNSPGCVNPSAGATVDGPTPPAAVQFTKPWDFLPTVMDTGEGGITAPTTAPPVKECDAGPPVEAVPTGGSKEKCEQVGTITVINDDPENPEWNVLAEAVTVTPKFTG